MRRFESCRGHFERSAKEPRPQRKLRAGLFFVRPGGRGWGYFTLTAAQAALTAAYSGLPVP